MLMAVFVEAPWAVIREAKPVLIGGYEVGILDRSAAYWKAQGNTVWGEALRGFRVTMVALGAFAVVAAVLEIIDIAGDIKNAKTLEEKIALYVKGAAVIAMLGGGSVQLAAGLRLTKKLVFFASSPWFAVALLIAGVVYLIASLVLNYFKQDSVGWWLRKCCWSRSFEHRHADNPEGEAEEKRSLLAIQLSPQIFIKSTMDYRQQYTVKGGHAKVAVRNGAWIQLRLPEAVRGKLVALNVISSKRPLGVLPTVQAEAPLVDIFECRGQFTPLKELGRLGSERPPYTRSNLHFPIFPPGEDVVWQTWVPLEDDVDYIELQIWYPAGMNAAEQDDQHYLYQIEPDKQGNITVDGTLFTYLEVSKKSRANALILVVPE
ncbi:putative Membrane protein [Pseudomonas cichorii]|uniref:Putative Membrane protein n=1 Tax=Pseudomonas cichorii TaxID=36746 RepID=A0A3M4MA82_PSECI|nr:putative Membrane protein [Pseudomonas cichorii]